MAFASIFSLARRVRGPKMPLIVIIDDRITNRNIFSKLASSVDANVVVRAFGNPNEALTWLGDNVPDLIITDFKMPDLDGAEFIRLYRALPGASDVPIIVITVYEERSFRLRALEAGATDFLHSPVDHHEFVTRARNLLKMREQQKQLASRADKLEIELEHSEQSRERALRDSSERLANVIDTLPVMIYATDGAGKIMFVNRLQASVVGADAATVIGAPLSKLFGDEAGARAAALDRLVFESGSCGHPYEEEEANADGEKRVLLTTKSPLMDGSGQIAGVLTSSLDITSRKAAEAHMRRLAHHDPLTGLANRALLMEQLERQIARARRGDQLFALHVLNIDGFRRVNEVHGHGAGDRYLVALGEKLADSIRSDDMLARLSGDEFAVLQTRLTSPAQAATLAQKLIAAVGEIDIFEESRLRSGVSVGIAIHPSDGVEAEEIVQNAALAAYRVKSENGNSYCFYAADMQARARQQATLDTELRRAVDRGEFVLYYQPQIDLYNGRLVGAEALLRWQRPGVGVVSPGVFLARAEENRLIVPINEWVLKEACREAKTWQVPGRAPVRVGVNLSPIQFRKRTIPLLVAKVLADSGLDPRALDLELTEGILMQDLESVAGDLRKLLDLGVSVAIDDFGTGYSSLNYIKRLPISRLKIDQSFVRGLCTDPNDAAIIRAIVTLGHSLDLSVLAEGVETPAQLARLRSEGCDEGQGYHIGRPMPAAEFKKRLLGRDGGALKSA
jgi:diguanylate cyclase (GGDEF)-like protein/PAS domain S-box-containing protein